MKPLSLGKIRSLQQLTNELGVFTVIALDHRGTFLKMLKHTYGEAFVTWENVAAEKIRIATM